MRLAGLNYAVLLIPLLFTAGCASSPDSTDVSSKTIELTGCTEPRPEICTMEYDPVCATHKDGSNKTYATGCTACSNDEVIGYNPGACE